MLRVILQQHQAAFKPVVSFDPATERLLPMDFTAVNTALTKPILTDLSKFCRYINQTLTSAGCRLGIGGYAEHRTIYAVSPHFDTGEEPRRLHLGIDIWGPAGTAVFAPLNGHVHSFRYNDHFGDYGATIILQHQLNGQIFYTLYGHLSVADLQGLYENMPVAAGDLLAHFGQTGENGQWPPHLHFQVITNMQGLRGDFPGVCKYSEKEKYLANCPDPELILQMSPYTLQRH